MSEFGLKMRMLWLYGLRGAPDWYREVWLHDAGQRMCCDGRMCGCYGADYFSYWEWLWRDRKGSKR